MGDGVMGSAPVLDGNGVAAYRSWLEDEVEG